MPRCDEVRVTEDSGGHLYENTNDSKSVSSIITSEECDQNNFTYSLQCFVCEFTPALSY